MVTFKPCENMDELVVNHIDGNKQNNSLDNLEWVTNAENVHSAYIDGLANTKGEKHGRAKFTEKEVIDILKMIKEGKSTTEIKATNSKVTKKMFINYAIISVGHIYQDNVQRLLLRQVCGKCLWPQKKKTKMI